MPGSTTGIKQEKTTGGYECAYFSSFSCPLLVFLTLYQADVFNFYHDTPKMYRIFTAFFRSTTLIHDKD